MLKKGHLTERQPIPYVGNGYARSAGEVVDALPVDWADVVIGPYRGMGIP